MQLNNKNIRDIKVSNIWGAVTSLFSGVFNKRSGEDKVLIEDAKVDRMVEEAKAEAEVEMIETKAEIEQEALKREAKMNKKINRKINKSRKAISVTELKVGKPMFVKYPGVRKRGKVIFGGYDDKVIYDKDGKTYNYDMVFTYRGHPVMKEEITKK